MPGRRAMSVVVALALLAASALATTAPDTISSQRRTENSVIDIHQRPLRPGDTVQISVFELEIPGIMYTTTLTIDAQGNIPIPGIKDLTSLHAAGLTPARLEEGLADFYVSHFHYPKGPGPEIIISRVKR